VGDDVFEVTPVETKIVFPAGVKMSSLGSCHSLKSNKLGVMIYAAV
jgi:hypothetical protein